MIKKDILVAIAGRTVPYSQEPQTIMVSDTHTYMDNLRDYFYRQKPATASGTKTIDTSLIPENIKKGMLIHVSPHLGNTELHLLDAQGIETGEKIMIGLESIFLVVRLGMWRGWVDVIAKDLVCRLYPKPGLHIKPAEAPSEPYQPTMTSEAVKKVMKGLTGSIVQTKQKNATEGLQENTVPRVHVLDQVLEEWSRSRKIW